MTAPARGLPPPRPAADPDTEVVRHPVKLSLRSRLRIRLFRLLLKPVLNRLVGGNFKSIARAQLKVASMPCPDSAGLPLDYRVVEGRVPGHVLGTLDGVGPVLLWLHGGAFLMPASPTVHLVMVARLCRDLGAAAFVPDYRLAPFNRFPAGLDDCERAYDALIARGYQPSQVVLGGDSAGANLVLGVLQRLRTRGLPMPACAVALSPVAEMGRIHAPPSRHRQMRRDPLLPVAALERLDELYAGDWDASDPQLSPLYMDCQGLPPMLFMASESEILVDDTILLAGRAQQAGVEASCHLWPHFPHAFPLFERYFPEVRPAREELARFAQRHL